MDEEKERLAFYCELLLQIVDTRNFPFYDLIIKNKLSKRQTEEILHLCEELNEQLKEQRELGFVHFTPLLIQFAGMLPYGLNIKETILALKKQKLYEELMDVLLKELEQIKD